MCFFNGDEKAPSDHHKRMFVKSRPMVSRTGACVACWPATPPSPTSSPSPTSPAHLGSHTFGRRRGASGFHHLQSKPEFDGFTPLRRYSSLVRRMHAVHRLRCLLTVTRHRKAVKDDMSEWGQHIQAIIEA